MWGGGVSSDVSRTDAQTKTMRIGNVELGVVTAITPEERMRGLSGRKTLGADGMFFYFDEADYHGMWMKEMSFPIDIVWIDAERHVVGIDEHVDPDTYPRVFAAPVPVPYALEMNAGAVDTFGIEKGDVVALPE